MVKIRLKRLGRKHSPFYRIVVTDIRNRRDGAPLMELGYYNPMNKQLKLDKKAALDWISKGAQPTDSALRLINKADENGELITLEVAKKDRLSKKAAEKVKALAAQG
jgi:small subunit ribosomal protein S16